MPVRPRIVAALALAAVAMACDANPFDASQVPKITVTPVVALPLVLITYEPQGAALIRVYRGTAAGQGYGPDLWWSIASVEQRKRPVYVKPRALFHCGAHAHSRHEHCNRDGDGRAHPRNHRHRSSGSRVGGRSLRSDRKPPLVRRHPLSSMRRTVHERARAHHM